MKKSKPFENQANDMLFWITWLISNLVYVKTYHNQNPFQALDHDYTRLSFSFLINIQGHIIQKSDFPIAPS